MDNNTARPLSTTLRTTAARVIGDHRTFDVRDSGEVNATLVAENVAWELGHAEWLDDDTHAVWDVALVAAEKANRA